MPYNNSVPQVVVKVYDRTGLYLDQLQVRSPRSYLLNDIGQCVFTVSIEDPRCTENILRVGNLIKVVSNNGAPDWDGVIDLPIKHNMGSKTITAYSAEYLLKLNIVADFTPGNGTAGSVISSFLAKTMPQLSAGIVSGDGASFTYSATRKNVYDIIKNIVGTAGGQFRVYYKNNNLNSNITIYYDYLTSFVKKNGNVILDESVVELVETGGVEYQGPFYNKVRGYGTTQNAGTNTDYVVIDQASIDTYGAREKVYQVDSQDPATITALVNNYWNMVKKPQKVIQLATINWNSNLWSLISIGLYVRVKLSWVRWYNNYAGLDSTFIVTGLSVDELSGVMVFTVQEYL